MLPAKERLRILEEKVEKLEEKLKILSQSGDMVANNAATKTAGITTAPPTIDKATKPIVNPLSQSDLDIAEQSITKPADQKHAQQPDVVIAGSSENKPIAPTGQPVAKATVPPDKPNQYRTKTAPNSGFNKSFNLSDIKEVLIGKYLIGALAALLLFVGAGSFVVMVWDKITPEIKLFAISAVGILLTAIGFLRIKKDNGTIASIILGSGAGITYIAILSARLAFGFIDNNVAILLCGAWALFLISSSFYTNLFFTTIIAYIGSLIALILGLKLAVSDIDILMLFVFITAISAVMLFAASKRVSQEFSTSILLVIIKYSVILLFSCFGLSDIIYAINGTSLPLYVMQVFMLLAVYGLMNLLYYSMRDTQILAGYILASVITTVLTMALMFKTIDIFNISIVQGYIIVLILHLLQYAINSVFHRPTGNYLEIYQLVIIGFVTMIINLELFKLLGGFSLIALLLLLKNKIMNEAPQTSICASIALGEAILLTLMSPLNIDNNFAAIFYAALTVLIMVYLLFNNKTNRNDIVFKILAMIVFLINCFIIPQKLFTSQFGRVAHVMEWSTAISYSLAVLLVIITAHFGYFTVDTSVENKKSDKQRSKSDGLSSFFTITIIVLYVLGIFNILAGNESTTVYVYCLATIAVVMQHSKTLFSGKERNTDTVGLIQISEYLILAWSMVYALGNSVSAFIYSVIGLAIAVVAILIGFKYLLNGIRKYGLILTIVMVAKFIIIDLSGENSIKRVAALIAGAVLCFIISYIYNKLSARLEENEQAVKETE